MIKGIIILGATFFGGLTLKFLFEKAISKGYDKIVDKFKKDER